MKKIFLMFLVSCVFIFGISVQVQARLVANHSPDAFEDEETKVESIDMEESYSIRELVIISAGYFLKGLRYTKDLSQKVELSDIQKTDFYAIRGDANAAISEVYNAWYYYQELKTKADQTPYNRATLEKLAAFDYDGFRKQNGLITDIFDDVKAYLIKGDVRGVYYKISNDIVNIYWMIDNIRYDLYWNQIPNNDKMWNLNQQCAKTLLFGQYVARIFDAIK